MSPPKKHVAEGAKHTTVRLTAEDHEAIHEISKLRQANNAEDHEAIHEISKLRQANNNDRTRKNDIMVDALYHLLKEETGKARDDIKKLMPPKMRSAEPQSNITQMPPPKKKR